MEIKGKTKMWEVIPCTTFWKRLKGNMGKKKIENILFFPKCNSIHTFFMKTKIDVVMISKDNIVEYCFSGISPWRVILPKRKVQSTLEFPNGENPYQKGDKIPLQKEK